MNKEVIIVAGANGSGKTTFARSFESQYPFKFINADEWYLVYNSQQQFVEIAIGSLDNYTINDKDFFLEFIKDIKEDDNGS